MEAATVDPPTTTPQDESPAVDERIEERVVAAAEKSNAQLFQWSEWVDIGAGSEDCEHSRDGKCAHPNHFHAWVRLPNPFQIRDITEKAEAAKARRLRMLRDTESDVRIVLENELSEITETGKDTLADDIVDREFNRFYAEAVRAVDELELEVEDSTDGDEESDEPPKKKYAQIDQDREEYMRQRELPEEQRGDDFDELERTWKAYLEDIDAELQKRQEPYRESLMERDLDDLISIIRQDRIEMAATEVFLHTFSTWTWYVCTYKPRAKGTPNERMWSDINQMKYETAGEIIVELRGVFDRLEAALGNERAAKN